MTRTKKKAFYALATLVLAGSGLMVFILAADEQSLILSGQPDAERIRLQDLVSRGAAKNKHLEVVDFYLGHKFVYTTELVQFNEVYVPMFVRGGPEDGSNLHFLLLIRNDRNSNQPLIQTTPELSRFAEEFNRGSKSVTGVLRQPINRVRSLTVDQYPGTNSQSLQILWARNFPTQDAVNIIWAACTLCLIAAAACGGAYWRQRGRSSSDT